MQEIKDKTNNSVEEKKELDEAKKLLDFYRGLDEISKARLMGFSEGLYQSANEPKVHPTAS